MLRNIDWKSEIIKAIFKYLVTLVCMGLLTFLSGRFRARLEFFDRTLLIFFLLSFVVLAVWDLVTFRKSTQLRVFVFLYVLVAFVFVATTYWSKEEAVKRNMPIYISFVLLGLLKISHVAAAQARAYEDQRRMQRIGFSATGVVVSTSNPKDPYFILVFNRNLREGKGLWVPPGGHFTPYEDDPVDALLLKIRDEIGMTCTTTDGPHMIPRDLDELRTDRARWLRPPSFLLEEDLMGRCSRGHEFHMDFVYVLATDGAIAATTPKYPKDVQLSVPVRECVGSVQDAEQAISGALDRWHLETTGAKPGVHDTLTRDVASRLHLASEIYMNSLEVKTGTS
jgi:hypothetical protein